MVLRSPVQHMGLDGVEQLRHATTTGLLHRSSNTPESNLLVMRVHI